MFVASFTDAEVLSATASVAATLLGISIAAVAILPAALELGSPPDQRPLDAILGRKRVKRYFIVLAASLPLFAAATLLALGGLTFECDGLARPAVATCAVGIVAVVLAAGGLIQQLLRASGT